MNPDESGALEEKRRFEKEDSFKKAYILKKKRKNVLISAALLIAAGISVYFINPENTGLPSCISQIVFNVYCPACGMTRAAYHLMHFNFMQAFYYNQFLLITLPFFAYIYAANAVNTYFDKKIMPLFKFNKTFAYIFIAVFILYGVLRNIDALYILTPRQI